jgi:adenylate cyclase
LASTRQAEPAPSRPRNGSVRRLAAIAALDVVGYSTLMERDEAGAHARWMRLRSERILPSVRAHECEVVSDTGDGFLIEFRSVAAAIRWATQLQGGRGQARGAGGIVLRIALHAGEIIAEQGTVFGEDVNIAARLQEFADPGGVILSSAAVDHLRGSDHPPVEPLGPIQLKNINKPIFAHRLVLGEGAETRPSRIWAITHRPTIAVLPLRILEKGRVERHFAEGILHELVGSLSAFKELFVVASSSTLRFGGARADPAEAGRRLGVRYLLTGSVSRSGDRLRLMCELSDLETHSRLWGTRSDMPVEELFVAQESIASMVAHHLLPHLRQSELQHALRKPPERMDAYDLFLQALHKLYSFERGDFAAARQLLERALARDADYGPAHAMLAKWHILDLGQAYASDRQASADAALAAANRAIELNPADPLSLAVYGHTLAFMRGDLEQATHAFERATAAGPNSSIAWALSSATYAYLGAGPDAVARAQYGLRLSPLDPYAFFFEGLLGLAHYFNGAYEEAAKICARVLSGNPRFSANMRPLMASLVALDRLEEARAVAAAHREADPGFRVSRFRERYPLRDRAQLAAYCERLLAAGAPE